jgi:hypothetical protein
MPPTTRRQSRLLGDGEIPVVPLVESRRSSKGESRKGSNAKKENVDGDRSLPRKQSTVSFDVPLQREDEKMEDATGDVPMEDIEVPASASSLKERTLSMEMNDAIQALHRDEEGEDDGDDQAHDEEDDEDDEQPTWSDEEDDDIEKDTQTPQRQDKKEGEDTQALYDEYDDEEDELPTWSDEDDDDGGSQGNDNDNDDEEINTEIADEDEDIEAPLPDGGKGTGEDFLSLSNL